MSDTTSQTNSPVDVGPIITMLSDDEVDSALDGRTRVVTLLDDDDTRITTTTGVNRRNSDTSDQSRPFETGVTAAQVKELPENPATDTDANRRYSRPQVTEESSESGFSRSSSDNSWFHVADDINPSDSASHPRNRRSYRPPVETNDQIPRNGDALSRSSSDNSWFRVANDINSGDPASHPRNQPRRRANSRHPLVTRQYEPKATDAINPNTSVDHRYRSNSTDNINPNAPIKEWDMTDSESDGTDLFENFDFSKFSATNKSPNSQDVVSPTTEVPGNIARRKQKSFEQLDILTSRWTRNSFHDAVIGAEISVASQDSTDAGPLIRWIHLERDLMIFDELVKTVYETTEIKEDVKAKASTFLGNIRDDRQKQRQYGCDMEPNFECEYKPEDGDGEGIAEVSMLFACLPMLSLDKYAGHALRSLPPGSTAHPARGFIQAHTRASDDKRELMQAITARSEAPVGNCLHVSSLWCLIIDETLMITCSRLGIDELGSEITKSVQPPAAPHWSDVQVAWNRLYRWQIPGKFVDSLPKALALFGQHGGRDNSILEKKVKFSIKDKSLNGKSWSSSLRNSNSPRVELRADDSELSQRTTRTRPMPRGELAPDLLDHGLFSEIHELVKSQASQIETGAGSERASHDIDHADGNAQKKDALPIQHHKCLGILAHAKMSRVNGLTKLADLVHTTLLTQGLKRDRDAYRICATVTYSQFVASYESTLAYRRNHQGVQPRLKGRIRMVAILAMYFGGFFWPRDFEHVAIGKLFGAVLALFRRLTNGMIVS
jgi:hypothetical protein